jgi:hypothetical protein
VRRIDPRQHHQLIGLLVAGRLSLIVTQSVVIASEAKQSSAVLPLWIASSLRSSQWMMI